VKIALIVVVAIEAGIAVNMVQLGLKQSEDFDLARLTRAGFFGAIPVNPIGHWCFSLI
jgi:hypothetical protein